MSLKDKIRRIKEKREQNKNIAGGILVCLRLLLFGLLGLIISLS